MVLESGRYTIRSLAEGSPFANRNKNEDRSLLPKAVYCPNLNGSVGVWDIKSLGNDRYRLCIGDAAVAAIEDRLYAVLTDEPPPEDWIIKPLPHHGQNVYTIIKERGPEGWALTDEEGSPIAVRLLVVAIGIPPSLPPAERWEIVPFSG